MRRRLSNAREECRNFWTTYGVLVLAIGYGLACLAFSTWCIWRGGLL